MYLLPTGEELAELYSQIDPKQRFLQAAWEAINALTEDAIMPYFDDIEDDIINMRRDINGNRAPWYLIDHEKGQLRYKGKTFEYIDQDGERDLAVLKKLPHGQFVDSWDVI